MAALGGQRQRRRLAPWLIAAVLVVALAFGVVAWTRHEVKSLSTNIGLRPITPIPAARHPDAAYWCAAQHDLSGPLPDPQVIATIVNTAPNQAAYDATLAFYRDLVAHRSTTADLARVSASYHCP